MDIRFLCRTSNNKIDKIMRELDEEVKIFEMCSQVLFCDIYSFFAIRQNVKLYEKKTQPEL